MPEVAAPVSLVERWQAAWPAALAAWSPYTRLKPPMLCETAAAARAEGLTGSFAMIRLADQAVVVDLEGVAAYGIEDCAVEVLAHEIGHHVYAPASVTEHLRCLARMQPALPTLQRALPLVANLWTDLLINDRLQRSAGLAMDRVMLKVMAPKPGAAPAAAVWRLYARSYELLWGLPAGSLAGPELPDDIDADARLIARLVRHHARRWLDASVRFAAVLFPYLYDAGDAHGLQVWADTRDAGQGGDPDGLTQIDPAELRPPALGDPELDRVGKAPLPSLPGAASPAKAGDGQTRDPYAFGELLALGGLKLKPEQAAIRYYAERARPWLVPFPGQPAPVAEDELPEGLSVWETGEPLERIDWLESVRRQPQVVPGLTTVQRDYGQSPGRVERPRPLDLDLYVDSSGSMPDPRRALSWPALAGAVICLSALRAGASVHVTLWASKQQVLTTPGFVRQADAALAVLTGYYGGGTQFPLTVLRELHAARVKLKRLTHILLISDDGASTMFDTPDERGTPGLEVCARALKQAGGGGTLALNLNDQWERYRKPGNPWDWIGRARDEQGWRVETVATLEGLLGFARRFARLHYAGGRLREGGR